MRNVVYRLIIIPTHSNLVLRHINRPVMITNFAGRYIVPEMIATDDIFVIDILIQFYATDMIIQQSASTRV